jgi:hypothetical protein
MDENSYESPRAVVCIRVGSKSSDVRSRPDMDEKTALVVIAGTGSLYGLCNGFHFESLAIMGAATVLGGLGFVVVYAAIRRLIAHLSKK